MGCKFGQHNLHGTHLGATPSNVGRAEVKAGKLRDIVMSNSNKRAETELVLFATIQKLFQKTVPPHAPPPSTLLACGRS